MSDLIDAQAEPCMVDCSSATLSIAAPALPMATIKVPCRDFTKRFVRARDEIHLVATLLKDAPLDGLSL